MSLRITIEKLNIRGTPSVEGHAASSDVRYFTFRGYRLDGEWMLGIYGARERDRYLNKRAYKELISAIERAFDKEMEKAGV